MNGVCLGKFGGRERLHSGATRDTYAIVPATPRGLCILCDLAWEESCRTRTVIWSHIFLSASPLCPLPIPHPLCASAPSKIPQIKADSPISIEPDPMLPQHREKILLSSLVMAL